MNLRAIKAIARKDLKVISRSKPVLIPLLIVPLLLFVIMPGAMALFLPAMMEMPGSNLGSIEKFLASMPSEMLTNLDGYAGLQLLLAYLLIYMFAPLFLVVPMMTASVIAADSFAGEKERKTLEALLYSPATDREMLAGKVLAAWIPAVLTAIGGFVLYAIVVNASAWPIMGRLFFPNLMWIFMVIWVAPAVSAMSLGVMVLVSQRVNTFQEAYQLGSTVVVPVLLLVFGQAAGVLYLNVAAVLLVGLLFWLVAGTLLWFGAKTFQRGELIAKI